MRESWTFKPAKGWWCWVPRPAASVSPRNLLESTSQNPCPAMLDCSGQWDADAVRVSFSHLWALRPERLYTNLCYSVFQWRETCPPILGVSEIYLPPLPAHLVMFLIGPWKCSRTDETWAWFPWKSLSLMLCKEAWFCNLEKKNIFKREWVTLNHFCSIWNI